MRRAEPRIRVSALLRWQDRLLLCRHEKAGRGEYWLLPGGGVNAGESLVDALHRELARGGRHPRRDPGRRPDRARRLDLAAARVRREARRAHHLRGRSLGPLARGRHLAGRRRARPPALRRAPSSTRSSSIRRSSASCAAGSRATRRCISARSGHPRRGAAAQSDLDPGLPRRARARVRAGLDVRARRRGVERQVDRAHCDLDAARGCGPAADDRRRLARHVGAHPSRGRARERGHDLPRRAAARHAQPQPRGGAARALPAGEPPLAHARRAGHRRGAPPTSPSSSSRRSPSTTGRRPTAACSS